ncbi:MAG: OmpH family outer membrane protein, partial [Betaproteobacteria bacterium]
MHRLFKLVVIPIFCTLVTVSHAVDLKIGFVNTERVFKESAPAVRSQKKLQEEFSVREGEIKAVDAEAKGIRQRLEKDGLVLEETQRRNLEAELGRLSREMQRLQREFQEELNLAKNTE